jgi:hypothetical protein
VVRFSIAELAAVGYLVIPTDDDHGYIELPPYVENPDEQTYNQITEAADKLLALAKGQITADHWRRPRRPTTE